MHAYEDETCPVCFCDPDANHIVLECAHAYCRECLINLCSSRSASASAFSPLCCVAESCNCAIGYATLRQVLSPTEEIRLLDASFTAHINSQANQFHYCPTPDCPVVYRSDQGGTILQCPACLVRICPRCTVEYHEGLTCMEHLDIVSGGVQLLDKWRRENGVKSCPNCGVDIQKSDGCNHMACTVCRTHICWVCMETFRDSESVYNHMNRAHGGIGLEYY
ncbi:hypothetical protein FISHEDRAFT_46252 [Fistulina hepatica ATCC 64428]|uniref:RING-type domain-containing protein n=1 Tax=Fistulina hepatica ATCC 64428 TaxID=1128425 RepID=A0A0D7A889_9AGAR|nr:hypothetical protein FISHEDRAFT_46252 [Fistulina hepatica ATCC 64428]